MDVTLLVLILFFFDRLSHDMEFDSLIGVTKGMNLPLLVDARSAMVSDHIFLSFSIASSRAQSVTQRRVC